MKLLIHHPEKQTSGQRWLLGAITAGFWLFWIYLWLPFVSLLAWLFGYRMFEYHMIELGGYRGVLDLLGVYLLVILALGGALIAWAAYNIQRFGGAKDRRQPRAAVTIERQAQHFRIDAAQLAAWRRSQRLVIDHGDGSQITSVDATTQQP